MSAAPSGSRWQDLKALFQGLGYREVRTLLNSGSVVFSARLGAENRGGEDREGVRRAWGFAARVFVLGADEIAAALDENPFGKSATRSMSRLMVTLIAESADRAALKALAKQAGPRSGRDRNPGRLPVVSNGMAESKLAEALAKQLGEAGTTRNWATLSKLHALVRD